MKVATAQECERYFGFPAEGIPPGGFLLTADCSQDLASEGQVPNGLQSPVHVLFDLDLLSGPLEGAVPTGEELRGGAVPTREEAWFFRAGRPESFVKVRARCLSDLLQPLKDELRHPDSIRHSDNDPNCLRPAAPHTFPLVDDIRMSHALRLVDLSLPDHRRSEGDGGREGEEERARGSEVVGEGGQENEMDTRYRGAGDERHRKAHEMVGLADTTRAVNRSQTDETRRRALEDEPRGMERVEGEMERREGHVRTSPTRILSESFTQTNLTAGPTSWTTGQDDSKVAAWAGRMDWPAGRGLPHLGPLEVCPLVSLSRRVNVCV